MRILAIARNTVREAVRERLMLVLGLFGFALLLGSQALSPLALGEGRKVVIDFGLAGSMLLATLLSVSNHKPYTYPKGRIPEDPDKQKRAHAVKYSDFALGQFFRAAKKDAFWTNTIFAVVADHGARVYGSQTIPIKSYEIPLVILGPAAVHPTHHQGAFARVGGAQLPAVMSAAKVAQKIERYGWHVLDFGLCLVNVRHERFARKRSLLARRHVFY